MTFSEPSSIQMISNISGLLDIQLPYGYNENLGSFVCFLCKQSGPENVQRHSVSAGGRGPEESSSDLLYCLCQRYNGDKYMERTQKRSLTKEESETKKKSKPPVTPKCKLLFIIIVNELYTKLEYIS